MLRFVASGPFPQATEWGAAGSILGLAVHYALMGDHGRGIRRRRARPTRSSTGRLLAGLAYGLVTYVVMNLIVVPLRFPAAWPPKSLLGIGTQLFAHIVLVGIGRPP